MKLPFLSMVFVSVLCLPLTDGIAAPLGSPRPEAQANFQQLLATKNCPGCDLAGANMIRVDLHGANLEGANLAGAKLLLSDLSKANLKNANLQGAALGGADLAGADLRGANLTGAILEGAFLDTALIDGQFITRPHAEEDEFTGSGEKVYAPAKEQSKQVPYTHEMTVGDRQDLDSPPPAIAPVEEGESIVQEAVVDEQAVAEEQVASKKIVPMADVVLPEPAPDTSVIKPAQVKVEEEPVLLAEVKPKKSAPATQVEEVVSQPRADIAPPAEAADDGAAAKMVPEMKGNNELAAVIEEEQPPAVAQKAVPVVKEESAVEEPVESSEEVGGDDLEGVDASVPQEVSIEEVAVATEQGSPEPVAELPREAQVPQESETVSEEIISEDKSVSSMITAMAETAAEAPAPDVPLYTVETPDEAAAKQQEVIDRLLDEDRCLECDLSGADLSGENFKEADLERAVFRGAKLSEADFRRANLKGANFEGADLRGADFREADLYRTNFYGADLTGARFEEALLDSADFTSAKGVVLPEEKSEE